MAVFFLAYLGGVLTILSPCILPVLPFVFARAGKPFVSGGLPMLVGLALTFATVASLAAVGGGWAVETNEVGRYAAMTTLSALGITLLFPSLSAYAMQPLVSLGAGLSKFADKDDRGGISTVLASALLGVATGFLWAPCAGPVLGLILTGAALEGASVGTALLLLAYALGSATSMALALMVGGRVYKGMKRSLGIGEWIRRLLGVAVLLAVAAIAMGVDTGLLTKASLADTTEFETGLFEKLHPTPMPGKLSSVPNEFPIDSSVQTSGNLASLAARLPTEGTMPSLDGAVDWLNSAPVSSDSLRGKVVLVDFWTYSCINCLRALPYVRAWAEKYKSQGLVVIGVHTPEFAFEKNIANVTREVSQLEINYPVAIDNNYVIWRAFHNEYWPAHYFIDAEGRIRHHHFGEGGYVESESIIQELLAAAGNKVTGAPAVEVHPVGVEAASDIQDVGSPETYLGWQRSENFGGTGGIVKDTAHIYQTPPLAPNQWGLVGNWTVDPEFATLNGNNGSIQYRFKARDLHMVLGPSIGGGRIKFTVTVDGAPPGSDHGADTGADGHGEVSEQRLYQLIRQIGPVKEHTFEIRFADPGVEAYAFTFG